EGGSSPVKPGCGAFVVSWSVSWVSRWIARPLNAVGCYLRECELVLDILPKSRTQVHVGQKVTWAMIEVTIRQRGAGRPAPRDGTSRSGGAIAIWLRYGPR